MGKFLAMVGVDWEDLKDIRKYLPSWWEIRHLCFVYLERTYVNSKTGVYTFQNYIIIDAGGGGKKASFFFLFAKKLKALRAKIYHFRGKKLFPPLSPGIYTTVIILFYQIDQDVIQIFKNTKMKIVIGKTGNLILVNENSKFKTSLEICSNSTILKQLISVFVFRTFRQ